MTSYLDIIHRGHCCFFCGKPNSKNRIVYRERTKDIGRVVFVCNSHYAKHKFLDAENIKRSIRRKARIIENGTRHSLIIIDDPVTQPKKNDLFLTESKSWISGFIRNMNKKEGSR